MKIGEYLKTSTPKIKTLYYNFLEDWRAIGVGVRKKSMKIAVYHNQLAGGALRPLAEYLRQYSSIHHFDLYTTTAAEREFENLDRLVHRVDATHIPGSESPFGRYYRVLSVPRYGRQIAAKIDNGKYDVVFVNISYVTQAAEILPYLRTPHVFYYTEPFRQMYEKNPFPEQFTIKKLAKEAFFLPMKYRQKILDKKGAKAAGCIFTHSYYIRDYISRLFDLNATVIHLGVDTQKFRPMELKRQRSVLSVGAMHPIKGHQFVIDSVGTIPSKERPTVTIVGQRGDWTTRLEMLAHDKGVTMELLQNLSQDDLICAYNQAGVMAAGQYGEPFGLITLEAMACRTPVVAVREAGLAETVQHNYSGILTERDPHAFGASLIKVLNDGDLSNRLGIAGRQITQERWQWTDFTKKVDDLLIKVAHE